MPASSVLSVVLWAVALAAAIWILVPAIAFAFRLGGRLQTAVLPEVGPPEIAGADASLKGRLRQLAALGFRAAGQTRETCRFFSPMHWRWQQHGATRWLVSPDGLTHVTLHRLIADEPVRIGVVTLFGDRGLVWTSSPGLPNRKFSTPRCWRLGLENLDAAALLAKHEEQVAAFTGEHGVSAQKGTIAEIAAADNAASAALLRESLADHYLLPVMYLASAVVLVGMPADALLSPRVPFLLCVVAAGYVLLRWLQLGPRLRESARRSHGAALVEPDYVGPDGWIRPSRNERWLRVLAALAALLSCGWLAGFVVKVPALLTTPGQLLLPLLFVGAIALIIVRCAGRALGRIVLRKNEEQRNPKDFWSYLMWMNAAFGMMLDWSKGGLRHQLLYGVAALSLLVGYAGWTLEQRRER